MSIYSKKDYEIINLKIDDIEEQALNIKLQTQEPTLDEMKEVYEVIKQFIRDNNRVIYGGFAMNELLIEVNKDDAIYKENSINDIEFYSFDPIGDMIELCNVLQDKGFKDVTGQEAQHKETYTIYVNGEQYADLSYVPTNIFRRLPFKTIDGMRMIHPHFMLIDYYRMFNDPANSYWRFRKAFTRGYILQKNFSIHKADGYHYPKYNKGDQKLNHIRQSILDWLKKKDTMIVFGLYALNYFAHLSKHKAFGTKPVPHYEFISTDYEKDGKTLLEHLRKLSKDVRVVEYYPFFQFTGYRAKFFVGDEPVATIYHWNNMCIPYQRLKAIGFDEGKVINPKKSDDWIQMATYNYTFMMFRIMSIKARVDENKKKERGLKALSYNLLEMRNHFYKKTGKTLDDKTAFQEFTFDCVGHTVDPKRERRNLIKKRIAQNKKAVVSYRPGSDKRKTRANNNYKFPNSSGNIINKSKNFRIMN